MSIILDVGVPFLISKHYEASSESLQRCHTGVHQKTGHYVAHTVHRAREGEISLKYIHKNILSSSKYETQSVHNYTSLSCPNRARNVEYAGTNYNDLILVRNITK